MCATWAVLHSKEGVQILFIKGAHDWKQAQVQSGIHGFSFYLTPVDVIVVPSIVQFVSNSCFFCKQKGIGININLSAKWNGQEDFLSVTML